MNLLALMKKVLKIFYKRRTIIFYVITYLHKIRGEWGNESWCPENMAICGLQVRMASSSTAMNGAKFKCCDLPISSITAQPTTKSVINSTRSTNFTTTETSIPDSSLSDIKGTLQTSTRI